MIFSTTNLPSGFYVYFYLREDGTPYYVGKGQGNRAWVNHRINGKGVHTPQSKNRIIIAHHELSEVWAIIKERYYIRWFGRKDKQTGILHNRTDGGEGLSGWIPSKEWIENRSGDNNHMRCKEHRIRMSISNFGATEKAIAKRTGINHPLYRSKELMLEKIKQMTENNPARNPEHVSKYSGKNHYAYDHNIHHFFHQETNVHIFMTRYEFTRKYELHKKGVDKLVRGERKSHKGWRIVSQAVQQLNNCHENRRTN